MKPFARSSVFLLLGVPVSMAVAVCLYRFADGRRYGLALGLSLAVIGIVVASLFERREIRRKRSELAAQPKMLTAMADPKSADPRTLNLAHYLGVLHGRVEYSIVEGPFFIWAHYLEKVATDVETQLRDLPTNPLVTPPASRENARRQIQRAITQASN